METSGLTEGRRKLLWVLAKQHAAKQKTILILPKMPGPQSVPKLVSHGYQHYVVKSRKSTDTKVTHNTEVGRKKTLDCLRVHKHGLSDSVLPKDRADTWLCSLHPCQAVRNEGCKGKRIG